LAQESWTGKLQRKTLMIPEKRLPRFLKRDANLLQSTLAGTIEKKKKEQGRGTSAQKRISGKREKGPQKRFSGEETSGAIVKKGSESVAIEKAFTVARGRDQLREQKGRGGERVLSFIHELGGERPKKRWRKRLKEKSRRATENVGVSVSRRCKPDERKKAHAERKGTGRLQGDLRGGRDFDSKLKDAYKGRLP